MLVTLLATTLLARNGVIAIEGMAIGQVENGKWRSVDKGPKDKAAAYASVPNFTLSPKGTMESSGYELKYSPEDEIDSLKAWYIEPMSPDHREPAIWFGPKPSAPKMTFASPGSPVYYGIVRDYLKAKGIKDPKPRLDSVTLVDLDGNGSQEALIFVTSRKHDEMWSTLSLGGDVKRPDDFAAVLIRTVVGKKVKTLELFYTDGRKGSLDGFAVNCGIWDLDGLKGAEILVAHKYYESGSGAVYRFANGKIVKLAEFGVGV